METKVKELAIRIVYLNNEKRKPLTRQDYEDKTYGIDVLESLLSKDQKHLVTLVCRKFKGSEEENLYNDFDKEALRGFFKSLKDKGIKQAI